MLQSVGFSKILCSAGFSARRKAERVEPPPFFHLGQQHCLRNVILEPLFLNLQKSNLLVFLARLGDQFFKCTFVPLTSHFVRTLKTQLEKFVSQLDQKVVEAKAS